MRTRDRLLVAGLAGFLLLTASACSKSIQANSGSKSFEPGAKREAAKPSPKAATAATNGPAITSRPSEFAHQPPAEPMPLEPSGLDSAPTSVPSLSNVEPGQPNQSTQSSQPLTTRRSDEARVPSEIVVAKAEPADAGRRRVEEMQREQIATAAAGLEDVFFGFDSWQISDEGKQTLMLDAEWLKANPTKSVTIEGHCDERGTLAYNLVLGEKRAKAVQKYLMELGVSAKQLNVVSYGKERPFCNDHDEACYQKNRRGHLAVRAQ